MENSLNTLPPELLLEILLHTSPRRAYRWLQTNSFFHKFIIEAKDYWARVALHIVWRDRLIIYRGPSESLSMAAQDFRKRFLQKYHVENESLFHMVCLTRPYKYCMDVFLELVALHMEQRQQMLFHSTTITSPRNIEIDLARNLTSIDLYDWNHLARTTTPEEKVRVFLQRMTCHYPRPNCRHIRGIYTQFEIAHYSMRQVCKTELVMEGRGLHAFSRRRKEIMRMLDDEPNISPQNKRAYALHIEPPT